MRTARARRALGLAAATALLAGGAVACGSGDSGPRLTVEDAYLPRPVTTDTAGGFMTIRNDGDTDDRLTSVNSDISDDVQIHTTSDGTMRRVPSLPVPAGGALELSRGGDHLMFMDLARRPAQGEKVSVELHFEKSDPITIEIPVEATNHVPGSHHQ
ncbi:copper chaperone PCu(A)C [Streptomyces megasporus]|uniref:copper chaperone PCu(A)C n=1 Tax=Streptomyces megasporus TaxID=44060 RepID=UPI0004E0D4FE|nr:copper chaperone PCu(A)C [Streptomyces megasporus]